MRIYRSPGSELKALAEQTIEEPLAFWPALGRIERKLRKTEQVGDLFRVVSGLGLGEGLLAITNERLVFARQDALRLFIPHTKAVAIDDIEAARAYHVSRWPEVSIRTRTSRRSARFSFISQPDRVIELIRDLRAADVPVEDALAG